MNKNVSIQQLAEFRKGFMPMRLFELVDVDKNPRVLEVHYNSIKFSTWGVELGFNDRGHIGNRIESVNVDYDGEVSRPNYFVGVDNAQKAFKEAICKVTAGMNEQITNIEKRRDEITLQLTAPQLIISEK
jgi:hypothetical protein